MDNNDKPNKQYLNTAFTKLTPEEREKLISASTEATADIKSGKDSVKELSTTYSGAKKEEPTKEEHSGIRPKSPDSWIKN